MGAATSAQGDGKPVLESAKHILDYGPFPVKRLIVLILIFPVWFRGYARADLFSLQHIPYFVGVICLIGKQCFHAVKICGNESASLFGVVYFPACNGKSERLFVYIGNQMNLCCITAFALANLTRLAIGFHAAGSAMRLWKGEIDHGNIAFSTLKGKCWKNLAEYPRLAPAAELLSHGVKFTILFRYFAPQCIRTDDPNTAAEEDAFIKKFIAPGDWKKFLELVKLPFGNHGYFHLSLPLVGVEVSRWKYPFLF